jgi:FdhD protein
MTNPEPKTDRIDFSRQEPPAERSPHCSVPVRGTISTPAGEDVSILWQVPEEVPVAFVYNKRPHAVMMATPADLEDFAVGFSVAEDVIDGASAILSLKVDYLDEGIKLCIAADPKRMSKGRKAKRTIEGRSGCGLCGIEQLANAVRTPRKVSDVGGSIGSEAVAAAFKALRDHQPMNRVNRSVHAAAFCDRDGQILVCREDVGRHNALDKLIGALLRANTDPTSGFVIMSSRCSFELVSKAASIGVPFLATVSAPTALALDLAREAGMRLGARTPDGVAIFQ